MSDSEASSEDLEVKEELDIKPSTSGSVLFPSEAKFSNIKNKQVRTQQFQKLKREQAKVLQTVRRWKSALTCWVFQASKAAKKQRKLDGAPKKVPHTIDSLRIKDPTTITNLDHDENELVRDDLEKDEFSDYYRQSYEPKVLITYADNPLRVGRGCNGKTSVGNQFFWTENQDFRPGVDQGVPQLYLPVQEPIRGEENGEKCHWEEVHRYSR